MDAMKNIEWREWRLKMEKQENQQQAAKNLRVIVVRDGEEKVNLTCPIYTLGVLDTIIPEAIVEKINTDYFNLKEKIQLIKDEGHRPQTIFEMSTKEKSYKVWIE